MLRMVPERGKDFGQGGVFLRRIKVGFIGKGEKAVHYYIPGPCGKCLTVGIIRVTGPRPKKSKKHFKQNFGVRRLMTRNRKTIQNGKTSRKKRHKKGRK